MQSHPNQGIIYVQAKDVIPGRVYFMKGLTVPQDDKLIFSTGLDSLDAMLHGLVRGDNVVWQMDDVSDYIYFIRPFCRRLNDEGKPLVYFRFAQHESLLDDSIRADTFKLDPHVGFEPFISRIFEVIEDYGIGACYVFDCLSDLSVDWYSDRMLGNFFMLTCPHLFTFDTIAYFMLGKNRHTPFAVEAIHNTAQVVLDLFRSGDEKYLLPIKVTNVKDLSRHSTTMYMLHSCKDDSFEPVAQSALVSRILAAAPQPWLDFNIERRDIWAETFIEALKISKYPSGTDRDHHEDIRERLVRMIITREGKLVSMCLRYLALDELISIGKRMVGTGLVGGKSAGMLLARAILRDADHEAAASLLETHDSFFIGSDVFYTYLIDNGCWWDRRSLIKGGLDLEKAATIADKIRGGSFRDYLIEQFREMLNYFGQAPLIVRSSSLLEDSYGNAFSGKYESVFCANQGTPEERLKNFIAAVKQVYSSTMSPDALSYREHRGLLDKDEQMALLVQRVSGEAYGDIYLPHLAGVAYSFNPFVWNKKINPEEGVVRMVFGLGTHAVDRVGDDYTRIVSISAPLLRPEGNFDSVSKYSQRKIDLLDLKKNAHSQWPLESVFSCVTNVPWDELATRDEGKEDRARKLGIQDVFSSTLTFDRFLSSSRFISDISRMLKTLEKAYSHPVDIEFSLNFIGDGTYRINLLQCRPFQVVKASSGFATPENIPEDKLIISSSGPFIGQSLSKTLDALVYIPPDRYSQMNTSKKYQLAQQIGLLAEAFPDNSTIMLVGPGRWGSTMPQLGIPVSFRQIRRISVICEIAAMHSGLVPDLSLGTHFFNDLVETNILYMALLPNAENNLLNSNIITASPNSLLQVMPDANEWTDSIIVLQPGAPPALPQIRIHVDSIAQKGLVFWCFM